MPSATDAMFSHDDSLAAWDPLAETISGSDILLDLGGKTALDVVGSDDFLTLDVDLDLDDDEPNLCELSSDNSCWETMNNEDDELVGPELQTLPSFFHHGIMPRTPSPHRRSTPCDDETHQITPEKRKRCEVSVPDMTELQIQYQRTLKKLALSMQRSDETRSIVKQQRLCSSTAMIYDDEENNFFSSPQAKAIEEARKRLFESIHFSGDWPDLCF
jgi:hypothetical protein